MNSIAPSDVGHIGKMALADDIDVYRVGLV
jgi:hypothetical protein